MPDHSKDSKIAEASLDTSKLSLFFSYVLAFKLGKKTSYQSEENGQFLSVQKHSFKHSIRLSSILTKERNSFQNLRKSVAQSTEYQRSYDSQKQNNGSIFEAKINPDQQINTGYCCDNCLVDPIIGSRYNCQQCDVDMCQECYGKCQDPNEQRHEHKLTLVKKVSHIPLTLNLRRSLSHSQNIKSRFRQKLIKSSNLGQMKA